MGLAKEFKEFAVKGNMIDMAVGIIVGAGFGKIVSSLVSDVLMPPIGLLVGGVDFTGLKITLKEASEGVTAVTLNYGMFVQTVIDFLIVAFCVFMVVKGINALRRSEKEKPEVAPVPSNEEVLLREIRDALRAK